MEVCRRCVLYCACFKIVASKRIIMATLVQICSGLPLDPLPPPRPRDPNLPHAPVRTPQLSPDEKALALKNALRYFPARLHRILAPEFVEELKAYGHIYMYRFLPSLPMKAYPFNQYPVRCGQAAGIMHMIMNNLDPRVAQFPEELVTYGGNGQVLSNWAQFRLVMHYLSIMENDQTLVLYSGHPLGLFPSHTQAPRCVISNGMVVPNYSSRDMYEKQFAMGVSMYGQMTAGSYCYIGPQGIVHGTTLTVMNAARRYLNTNDLSGVVFVTSGLGGMSGAQAKAAVIAGCVGVVAEVNREALMKRYEQGWLMEWTDSVDSCVDRMKRAKRDSEALSLGYLGNVVDLWERLAEEYTRTGEVLVELGSDQTSLHNPYGGGYYPVGVSFQEAQEIMENDPVRFRELVQASLRRQVAAIHKLASAGMHFWDYGNAFLLEAGRAGAAVHKDGGGGGGDVFCYPSYVQDIMGDIFSLGFGPFRWVCTSGDPADLAVTDELALQVLDLLINQGVSDHVKQQIEDNSKWIREAAKHNLVVGSQARILYSNEVGRRALAAKFNKAVCDGRLKGPVVLSRDHHDVSGTDSPFRETSNIEDGSKFCADMAIQNVIGDAFRGATWVAIHNGGGVGWGEVINGGFGLLLDGSDEAGVNASRMLSWDVLNGLSRRSWSGHPLAKETICEAMAREPKLNVTLSHEVTDQKLLEDLFN